MRNAIFKLAAYCIFHVSAGDATTASKSPNQVVTKSKDSAGKEGVYTVDENVPKGKGSSFSPEEFQDWARENNLLLVQANYTLVNPSLAKDAPGSVLQGLDRETLRPERADMPNTYRVEWPSFYKFGSSSSPSGSSTTTTTTTTTTKGANGQTQTQSGKQGSTTPQKKPNTGDENSSTDDPDMSSGTDGNKNTANGADGAKKGGNSNSQNAQGQNAQNQNAQNNRNSKAGLFPGDSFLMDASRKSSLNL
ncbi:hypothetical protein Bpfe_031396 [Biomphalaria pfeifferi]|uniref:Uncharacterized protein n=1 Tax=Biomphalaria pfeifferi TaxID=112525 RepID=A0AAD8AQR4_BIOPF|nr:hypothetical protein Bpfe_031396 [Biomphalaria pfeifferi]